MKHFEESILKTVSSLALTLAVGSLSEASTIFTHQPKMNEELKAQLKETAAHKS